MASLSAMGRGQASGNERTTGLAANDADCSKGSKVVVAPIAVDLGAKHTGCFLPAVVGLNEGADPADGARGLLLEIDHKAFTLMMTDRRARRHQRRAYTRRRLAKRLVLLWLAERLNKLSSEDRLRCERFLRGLMNRRGFTYLSLDERIRGEELESVRPLLEATGLITAFDTVTDWLCRTVADPNEAKRILKEAEPFRTLTAQEQSDKNYTRESSPFKALNPTIGSTLDAQKQTQVSRSLKTLVKYLKQASDAPQVGHKHRREYLQNIEADLRESVDGKYTCEKLGLSPAEIRNLLGHISNWDLRALRSYFHDASRKCAQKLDPNRFHRAWLAFFRRWSFTGEAPERRQAFAQRRREWLELLTSIDSGGQDQLWGLLTTRDPQETIPPFESQRNRRPPRCQSLLLSPDLLDQHFPSQAEDSPPQWRIWARRLGQANPSLCDELKVIAWHDARAIGRVNATPDDLRWHELSQSEKAELWELEAKRWYDARLLQRVLERNRKLDPYHLRQLALEQAFRDRAEAYQLLEQHLGSWQVDTFLRFARIFYHETREARTGIWLASKSSLLRPCNAHPPRKRRLKELLVAQILGVPVTQQMRLAERVEAIILNTTVTVGQSSSKRNPRSARQTKVRDLVARMAAKVKEFGRDLKSLYELAESKRHKKESLSELEQEALNLYERAKVVASTLGQQLNFAESTTQRLANPFSLTQLHQTLFTEVKGFSSTCQACTRENHWRGQLDGSGLARAARLPSDSIRPFDGALARLIEAKAARLADEFVRTLPPLQTVTRLRVPILLEENRFDFQLELPGLKGIATSAERKKAQQAIEQRMQTEEQLRQDRYKRIRSDGRGLCPYCGRPVEDDGEYDHIVAQAVTSDFEGYSFNSEANLIYVHAHCNRGKGKQLYSLSDLAPEWLKRQFGTPDPRLVEERVRQTVSKWLENASDLRGFHLLEEDLRRDIRHGLFIPDVRGDVVRGLAMQNVARVNGTQRWFGRVLIDRLQRALKYHRGLGGDRLRFSLHRVPAREVATLRGQLATAFPSLQKQPLQAPYSHIVDATLLYAVATTQPQLRQRLGLAPEALDEFITPARALALLPSQVRIVRVQRRPIHDKKHPWHRPLFKANPIGERFVPLIVTKTGQVIPGFSGESANPPITSYNPRQRRACSQLLATLWPVLANPPRGVDPNSEDLVERLQEIAQMSPEGALRLRVDRSSAFRHWYRCRHKPDDKLAKVLDALVYRIQRVDLHNLLFDKRRSQTTEELLADKHFCFTVKLPGLPPHKVTLPCKRAWEALVNDPELHPHLGKPLFKKSERDARGSQAVGIDWNAIIRRHFNKTRPSTRQHRRCRQVIALPRLADASGGFRVERRGLEGSVFQLLQVDDGAYVGFARDSNKPHGFDPNQPALLPLLARSRSLTPLNRVATNRDIVPFTQPKQFDSPKLRERGFLQVEILPGTKPRRRVLARVRRSSMNLLFGYDPGKDFPYSLRDSTILVDKNKTTQLAALLKEATGIASLGPRENCVAILGWDHDSIELFWTAGTGKPKGPNTEITGES